MANRTGGFGLRQTMTVGNTPATGGQSEYLVQPLSTLPNAILKGEPVGTQTTAGAHGAVIGYVQSQTFVAANDDTATGAAWTTALAASVGVFNGGFWIDPSTSTPTWSNYIPGGQTSAVDYNTGSSNITAFVNDNPNQEYTVKCDSIVSNAIFGTGAYNLAVGTGLNNNGQSVLKLDTGAAVANAMWTVVRSANTPENNDFNAATSPLGDVNVIVTYAPGASKYA
jgi:hypothetical protein